MSRDKIAILENYIKAGISPILIENTAINNYSKATVIDSKCKKEDLIGHYEGINYVPPKWYNELLEKNKGKYSLLIVKNIDEIDKEEQGKFYELFNYKKISTFNLPKNCIIMATCSNSSKDNISERLYPLMVHLDI